MKRAWCWWVYFLFLSGLPWAATYSQINRVIALSVGSAWYRAGETQTVWLQPDFKNAYVANRSQHVLTDGELFLGLQRSLMNIGFGQLGLALVTATPARLQGDIWETSDPLFDNFSYRYKISHTHVALKATWLFNHGSSTLLPYFSGSLGLAWNRSYQFSTQSLLFEVLPVADFQSQDNKALTYTLGAGLQKMINSHWQLGMGYEFSDWGRTSLGPMPGQTNNSGLSLSHLDSHQLQCTISYLF